MALLLCALALFAYRLAVVENQRYAMQVGRCAPKDWRCLEHVQTRTSWLWHVYYGLGG